MRYPIKKVKKDKENLQFRLGLALQEKRKRLGYTAQDVANFTGISVTRISTLETGDVLVKTPEKFKSLCNILCDDGTLYAMWFILVNKMNFKKENEEFVIDQLKNIFSLLDIPEE